jgi:hypothetical protein
MLADFSLPIRHCLSKTPSLATDHLRCTDRQIQMGLSPVRDTAFVEAHRDKVITLWYREV